MIRALYQNFTNSIITTTMICFTLSERRVVALECFDVLGREVATLVDGELNPGEHSIVFDATGLPSGVYFVRFTAGKFYNTTTVLFMNK